MDPRARHRLNKKLIEAVDGRSLSWRMVAKGREHVIMVDMVLGVGSLPFGRLQAPRL